MIERVLPLICSRCHEPVMVAAVFLSTSDPSLVGRKGASRQVRLCKPCLELLLAGFAEKKGKSR